MDLDIERRFQMSLPGILLIVIVILSILGAIFDKKPPEDDENLFM